MNLAGQKALVVGCGHSGAAVARYLVRKGCQVTVSDSKSREALVDFVALIDDLPIRWELGGHSLKTFLSAELIVVSPGVPGHLWPLQEAKKQGIRIVSEADLAFRE